MPLQTHADLEVESHEAQESFLMETRDFNFEEMRWDEHLMDQSDAANILRKRERCANLAFGNAEHAKAIRHDHGLDAVSASRIAADVAAEAAEEALRLYDRASGHWPTGDAVLTHVERQAINAVDDAADLAVVARMAEATEAAAATEAPTVTVEVAVSGSSGASGADNCVICFERLGDNGEIATFSCGRSHQCCEGCAFEWLQCSHSCPQCRAPVEAYTLADGTQCDAPSVQHAEGSEPDGDAAVAQQLSEDEEAAYQRDLQRVRDARRERAELARMAGEVGSDVVDGEVVRPPEAPNREERAADRAAVREVRLAGDVSSSTPTPAPASDEVGSNSL